MANTSVIVIPEGKICDYVDGKFRNDTPEEYVRQTIEKRLVNEHKYLPKQIRIEYTLQLGSRKPRADIVIFDKDCGEQTQENIKIMVMNNDGSGNILQSNSLLPPHEWTDDFRSNLAEALGIDKASIRNYKTIEFFNVIVTNPPFGSKIPIKDKAILEQFELAHVWENDKETNTWTMTDRLQASVPPEILFVERCTQLLVPGGRMGIVLPDNILGAPGLGYIREWLIKNHRIVASVDLHVDTFQPRNGTQTSVLFLQKKTKEQKDIEEKSGTMADYNIFMAMVEKVGHDKRGNPTFKRDKEGNEILVPDTNSVLVLGTTGEGNRTVSHEQKRKVEDDQTPDVPAIFAEWKIKEGLAW